MTVHQYTIGKYLYKRLEQLGLEHIFGVPGDYIFSLLHLALESNIQYIGTCNELNAGYAADAYARFKGIGAVLVTYAVGGLNAVNAIAGAFAEKVPVVIISGGPELSAYEKQPQQHHTLGDYSIPLEIYKKITIASTCLLDPATATIAIDKLLATCMQYKQPVYLEIPCDVVDYPCQPPDDSLFYDSLPNNTHEDMQAAIVATLELLNQASQPVIIVGNEVQRYELQPLMEELILNSSLPFSTFITDKTTLPEQHCQFIGPCGPGIDMENHAREFIEHSDCILCFGSIMVSHLKTFMSQLNVDKLVWAFDHKVGINGKIYNVNLYSFVEALNKHFKHSPKKKALDFRKPMSKSATATTTREFHYQPKQKITNDKLFAKIATLLKKDDILIVDSGSSLFTARKIFMPDNTIFLSQSYYASLGYSLPAALGAALANPRRRIIVVIGDGAFQFTCQELSTLIKHGLAPIIFLINNDGYTIERALYKDAIYNDIQPWEYHKFSLVFGGNEGYKAKTEEELEAAIEWSKSNSGVSLIEIHLDKLDFCKDLATMLEP
jgi:TPP-dependent 2-oxoacid decarboxylase